MDKKKQHWQQLVKKCIESVGKAEDVLECPVCFDNSKEMLQCLTGHPVCKKCHGKLTQCPVCQNEFLGTKLFLVEELSDTLGFMKLSLYDLEEDVKKPIDTDEAETIRKLLKTILFNVSTYCNKNETFLLFLKKYLLNPSENGSQLETQLTALTADLRNLICLFNDTEVSLTSLKK